MCRVRGFAHVVAFALLICSASGLVQAGEADSRKEAVLRVLKGEAAELVTDAGVMVPDWELRLPARAAITVEVERVLSKRAIMDGGVVDALTFSDDQGRYDLFLDPDGAILLDVKERTTTDSGSFTVGPVPVIVNRDEVFVAALGKMAQRGGACGVFDLEVGELSATTATAAIAGHDSVAVYVEEGAVTAFFYRGTELRTVLVHYLADEPGANRDGGVPNSWYHLMRVCEVLYNACLEGNIEACGHWLDHCQGAPTAP